MRKDLPFRDDAAVREVLQACPPLAGERYRDGQIIFRRSTNQQQLMVSWLETHFLSQPGPDPISFLSIGAGTGIFDVRVIEEFLRRNRFVEYEGIDPNKEVLSLLEDKLKPLACEKLKVNIILSSFESYRTQKKFSFILLVHTHYFFCDLEQNLQRAWNLLEEGGTIILYSALDIFLSQFFKVTFQSNFGHPPWLSHDVQRALHALNIPFRRESIRAELDVSACFGADEKDARDLLAFIIHAEIANKSGGDVLRTCLQQNATRENGRYLLPHTVDVFVIGKN